MAEFFSDYEEIISMRSYGYRIIRQKNLDSSCNKNYTLYNKKLLRREKHV